MDTECFAIGLDCLPPSPVSWSLDLGCNLELYFPVPRWYRQGGDEGVGAAIE